MIRLFLLVLALAIPAKADLATTLTEQSIEFKVSEWQGHARADFALPDDGAKCSVIAPKKAAEGSPWIWRARFFGHQPALDVGLLKAGWHVCYCDISNLYGSPKAVARWDKFHALATTKLGLAPKPVLEGMSRGGLIIFNWASANPDKVRAIYGDNPVCNFVSWPGGKNGKRSDGDWKRCLAAYGIDEADAATTRQPRDEATLKPIAAAKIPVFLVLGEADKVVPVAENADPLAATYKNLGGPVRVWRKPGLGHHPHGLDPVAPLLEAILASAP
jgi:pimeloyl-ACP methyl ester carboxylesterase